MATYKVLQDIEAEDKLLGPLSLRQFIYAVIVAVTLFVMFKLAMVQPLLAIPFLPVVILFTILAAPFGHDQSSEIWLLAKIRFALKPRRRIWNQSGLQELVKVTAPKMIEQILTDGLDQGQVVSRLEALAKTIDTRGWVIKGVNSNQFSAPVFARADQAQDDRLLSLSFNTPTDDDLGSNEDILDVQNNPLAQKMDQMVQVGEAQRRQALLDKMGQIRDQQAQAPISTTTTASTPAAAPQPAAVPDEPNISFNLPPKQDSYGRTAVLQPDIDQSGAALPAAGSQTQKPVQDDPLMPVTAPPNPAILGLASNDDLTVAGIARQANKATGDGEVIISLR